MLVAAIKPFMVSNPGRDAIFPQLSIVAGVGMREQKINFLEAEITSYLFQIMRQELSPRNQQKCLPSFLSSRTRRSWVI